MGALQDILDAVRVAPGKKFRLKDHDPSWAGDKKIPKGDRKKIAIALILFGIERPDVG